jgi:hypothetical protein
METKSSWSAAAGIDWPAGGRAQDALLHDQVSAVYWLSIRPAEHARALRQEGGQAHAEGRVQQAVQAALAEHADHGDRRPDTMSIGSDTGEPWKLAPVRVRFSFRDEDRVVAHAVQLDLHLLRAQRRASWAAPMTCGSERME